MLTAVDCPKATLLSRHAMHHLLWHRRPPAKGWRTLSSVPDSFYGEPPTPLAKIGFRDAFAVHASAQPSQCDLVILLCCRSRTEQSVKQKKRGLQIISGTPLRSEEEAQPIRKAEARQCPGYRVQVRWEPSKTLAICPRKQFHSFRTCHPYAALPSCDSLSTSRCLALGASNVFPTCSVPVV